MLKRLNILLLCMLTSAGSAFAQEAEKALKEFEGKVLLLRHPLHGNQQQYDSAGKVLKGGVEEAWTAYGGVLINHVTLTPNQLQIEAKRMLFQFPQQKPELTFEALEFKPLKRHGTAPFSPSISVDIMLDQPVDSEEQARTILGRVFALNTEDFLASVSDLWRPYLAGHFTYDSSLKREAEFTWQEHVNKPPRSAELEIVPDANDGSAAEPIFHVGGEVKAPRAQVTPEPDYSEIARYEKFSGVVTVTIVVGKDGMVKRITVVRPLGLGLEETTQSTIKDWRFSPAQRDGKPVSVEMNVLVSFNLY